MIKQAEDLIAAEELDKAKLTQKRAALNKKKDILKALDNKLLPSVPDDHLEDEIESSDDVQEQIALATMMISKVLVSPPPSPVSDMATNTLDTSRQPSDSRHADDPPTPALSDT